MIKLAKKVQPDKMLNSSNGKIVKLLQTAELHSLLNLCQLVRQVQIFNHSEIIGVNKIQN